LPEPLLCLVLAHEVGHATQRTALLFDLTKTVFGVTALIAGPCIMFAAWPGEDLWRISIPGALFAILMALLFPTWRARTVQRAKALELDADAKAATLCGARIALEAMEIMAKRGRVDATRLNVMRERCAHAEDAKEAKTTCR
jgi:Zn-dependent protease with chaperone function